MPDSREVLRQSFRAVFWLTTVFVFAFPFIAGLGCLLFGGEAVYSALVASLVCWPGMVGSLLVIAAWRKLGAVSGLLLGMFFRLSPPVLFGLMAFWVQHPLVSVGVVEMLVVYYLVALLAEVFLSVRLLRVVSG